MIDESLDEMADPIPDIRDTVEWRGLVSSGPRSRSWENPALSPSGTGSGEAMTSLPLPFSCLFVDALRNVPGSKLSPTAEVC
jgi:hypothetical protein